jgi:D-beta-D-heptose 7-phosphate kinase/D-beta-D-heptose 1-phosphate adenosyltransferase
MNVIFVNGCFDILHLGHFALFNYCKELLGEGGRLVVGIDTDRKIKEDKGFNRPIFSQNERVDVLRDLLEVLNVSGEVHLFDTNQELYEMIKLCRPNLIVKSDDWSGNVVGSDLAEVRLFRRMEDYSSTEIIHRILGK